MQISEQKVALIHYTLTNDAGEVLDKSEVNEPLVYLHGAGNIIPGLESALAGKQAGDTLNVVVAAAEAYGERHDGLVQEVPRDAFQGVEDIQAGMRFQAQTDNGPVSVVVSSVTEQTVTVDGNHPLAGQQLTFDVEVVAVREANQEELAHGHPHGPAGDESH